MLESEFKELRKSLKELEEKIENDMLSLAQWSSLDADLYYFKSTITNYIKEEDATNES